MLGDGRLQKAVGIDSDPILLCKKKNGQGGIPPVCQLEIEVKRTLETIPYALFLGLVVVCLSKDVSELLLRKLYIADQYERLLRIQSYW